MPDLSYLEDPQWVANREIKWNKFKNHFLFDSESEEIKIHKEYFFTGNVQCLLTEDFQTTLYTVVSNSPLKDVQSVIENISTYWCWVLDKPGVRDDSEMYPDINIRFLLGMEALFSIRDDFMHPEVCVGLFFWLYGEEYTKERVIIINCNSKYVVKATIDVNEFCFKLIHRLIEYLWYEDTSRNNSIYKSFIPYFLSIYPHMSKVCFQTTMPEDDKFQGNDGVMYEQKYLVGNRWLLTTLNGFITEHEEDEGIEELVCNDEDALSQLKEGLASLKMPDEFYRLQEFVLEHKGESLYASS